MKFDFFLKKILPWTLKGKKGKVIEKSLLKDCVLVQQEDLTIETMKDSLPDSATRQRPGSGRERPESASRARTDSIMSMEVCMSNAVFNRYHHKRGYLTKF